MAEERDPKLSQRYRELGREEPSRELDQTILAAAHRSADKPHAPLVTPAGRHRWYFAFGAAAVLVLAVTVTVHVERQRPDAEAMTSAPASPPQQEPAATVQAEPSAALQQPPSEERRKAKVPAAAPPPKPDTRADVEAKGARLEQSTVRTDEARPDAAAAPPPSEPPASSQQPRMVDRQDVEAKARLSESIERRERGQGPASQPASTSMDHQPRAAPQVARVESPERWLERIVQLRKEGRHEEAEKQLAEFRRSYPDYKVPEAALRRE